MEMSEETVKIGKKSIEKYREALLYSIENYDKCIIRALGCRTEKAEELQKFAESFDGLEVKSKKLISVGDTPGIQIRIEVVEDG